MPQGRPSARLNRHSDRALPDWGDRFGRATVREVAEYLLFLFLIFGSLVLAAIVGVHR